MRAFASSCFRFSNVRSTGFRKRESSAKKATEERRQSGERSYTGRTRLKEIDRVSGVDPIRPPLPGTGGPRTRPGLGGEIRQK